MLVHINKNVICIICSYIFVVWPQLSFYTGVLFHPAYKVITHIICTWYFSDSNKCEPHWPQNSYFEKKTNNWCQHVSELGVVLTEHLISLCLGLPAETESDLLLCLPDIINPARYLSESQLSDDEDQEDLCFISVLPYSQNSSSFSFHLPVFSQMCELCSQK